MINNVERTRGYIVPSEDQLGGAQQSVTIMSILLALLKRPWILFLSILIVIVPLSYYLLAMKTTYMSSAMVMLSVNGVSILNATTLVEGGQSDAKAQKYYTSILDSRSFLDDVFDQMKLLFPNIPNDSLRSSIKNGIGYEKNPREEGFIKVNAKSQSKEFALALAETALDRFKARTINLERQDAVHVSNFINVQIDHVSTSLGQAEKELQSFLSNKNIIAVDVDAGITQELSDLINSFNDAKANYEMMDINIKAYDQQLNELLTKLTNESKQANEEEISRIKNRLNEIRQTLNNAVSLQLSTADIHALTVERAQLRNDLVNLVTSSVPGENGNESNVGITIQKLEEVLEASLLKQTEYQNQVQFYKLQIDRFKREHPNLSEDILTYASLSRAKEVLQKTLDILLEKREEVRIRVESEMGGIKVIDAPRLPDHPISRKKTMKFIMGLLASIILGIAVSVIFDRFDTSIKDENDIHQNFGLTVFSTIPMIDAERFGWKKTGHKSNKKGKSSDNPTRYKRLLTAFSEKSPTAEAYRSLKIAIQFIATDKEKKIFVISSPSLGEGKSLTTSNLAISFAQGGKRTLILDCDLRKSIQHKHFIADRKPGLVDYLYGDAELKDIIREVGIPHLYLIPAGSSPVNPAEMLASSKMKRFMEELREQFDYIIIDTPPTLVCSDSRVIAEISDGMILVAKVESTNIKAFDHALNLLNHLKIDILGVILNQAEFRYNRAYYYTSRYYRPYSYYSGYYYKREYYDEVESKA